MTTTSVTAYASSYDVGIRHVYFSGYASTATAGDFWRRGWCEWHVYYPGSTSTPDESYYGTPNFSFVCTTAGTYTFKYRAIDDGGNAGSWAESTVVVENISTADYVQYVDPTSGSNSNDGLTSGAPVQTLAQASTNIKANWTTNGTHVIYVKKGETATGGPIWSGHTANGRIIFTAYGSGADPILRGTSGDIEPGSGQTSMVFWNVDLDFDNTGDIRLDSAGVTRTVPYDFIAYGVTMTSAAFTFIKSDDDPSARTLSTRDTHGYGFVAVDSCTMTSSETGTQYGQYGLALASCIHWVNSTVGSFVGSGVNPHVWRIANVSDMYVRGCTFQVGVGGGSDTRFMTLELTGEAAATRRITFQDCVWDGDGASCSLHEYGSNESFFYRDITLVGCNRFAELLNTGGGTSGSGFDVDRMIHRNCYTYTGFALQPHATEGGVGQVAFEHCIVGGGGGGYFLRSYGEVGQYTVGGLHVSRCVCYWYSTDNPEPRRFYHASDMPVTDFETLFGTSDYNHCVKIDSDSTQFFTDEGLTNNSLATWQGETGLDSNSSVATSQSISVTSTPDADWVWDPRLSSTGGYLADKGEDRTYTLDIDGQVRVGDYAGPHDPEASTSPTQPSVSGSKSNTRLHRIEHGIYLGGELSE